MIHRVLLAVALMLTVCALFLDAGAPRAVPHPAAPHAVPHPMSVPHPVAPPIHAPQGVPHVPHPQVNPQMRKGMNQLQKELQQVPKVLQVPKGLKDGMDHLRNGKLPGGALDLLRGMSKPGKFPPFKAPHLAALKPFHVPKDHSLEHFRLHHRAKVFQALHDRHHGHWHWHHRHHWLWGSYLPIADAAGQVVEVLSGNRLVVLNTAGVRTPIRLFGTGAPAFGQALFSESQGTLSGQALDKFVNVVEMGQDADGTLVAQVFPKGEETYLSQTQIRQGMGWYAYDDGEAPDLAFAEVEAQSEGCGVWSNPDAPWEYSG